MSKASSRSTSTPLRAEARPFSPQTTSHQATQQRDAGWGAPASPINQTFNTGMWADDMVVNER